MKQTIWKPHSDRRAPRRAFGWSLCSRPCSTSPPGVWWFCSLAPTEGPREREFWVTGWLGDVKLNGNIYTSLWASLTLASDSFNYRKWWWSGCVFCLRTQIFVELTLNLGDWGWYPVFCTAHFWCQHSEYHYILGTLDFPWGAKNVNYNNLIPIYTA